jgi:hypothetical protein
VKEKAKAAKHLMRVHQLIAKEMAKDYVILNDDTVLLMVNARNTTAEAIADPEMFALLEEAGILDVCEDFVSRVDNFLSTLTLTQTLTEH